jgi:hypothetical protein
MAKQQPEEEHLDTVTMRIRADLARMIRIMCAGTPGLAGKKQSVVEYLDEKLREPVVADYEEFRRKLHEEDTSKSKPRSRPKRKE